jgi:hypothetical protein
MDRNTPPLADAYSSIGNLVDVATRGSWKAIILGLIWLLLGSAPTTLLVIALSAINWERSRGINEITGMMIPIAAGCALVAWFLLATAVRRFRAAFEPGCYLRAGPAGLSFRVPGAATLSSLLFGYWIKERHLRWDEVRTWYPYLSTINGIPSESAIVVEPVRGGRITISTMYFSESRRRIGDDITRAMSGDRP